MSSHLSSPRSADGVNRPMSAVGKAREEKSARDGAFLQRGIRISPDNEGYNVISDVESLSSVEEPVDNEEMRAVDSKAVAIRPGSGAYGTSASGTGQGSDLPAHYVFLHALTFRAYEHPRFGEVILMDGQQGDGDGGTAMTFALYDQVVEVHYTEDREDILRAAVLLQFTGYVEDQFLSSLTGVKFPRSQHVGKSSVATTMLSAIRDVAMHLGFTLYNPVFWHTRVITENGTLLCAETLPNVAQTRPDSVLHPAYFVKLGRDFERVNALELAADISTQPAYDDLFFSFERKPVSKLAAAGPNLVTAGGFDLCMSTMCAGVPFDNSQLLSYFRDPAVVLGPELTRLRKKYVLAGGFFVKSAISRILSKNDTVDAKFMNDVITQKLSVESLAGFIRGSAIFNFVDMEQLGSRHLSDYFCALVFEVSSFNQIHAMTLLVELFANQITAENGDCVFCLNDNCTGYAL